nr:MAG TPA: hypothetical protein [Caudoviricetes sp.]
MDWIHTSKKNSMDNSRIKWILLLNGLILNSLN